MHMLRVLLCSVMIVSAVASCASNEVRIGFDRSLDNYNESLRRREFNEAALFLSPTIAEQFRRKTEDTRNVRIIDFKIKEKKCDETAGEGTAVVVYEYYLVNTAAVKSISDTQRWKYGDTEEGKKWRLESLLPEFR